MTKTTYQKVLLIDVFNGYSKIQKFKIGDYFGPVDLGIHLAYKHKSLNVGTGLLAGSIFPGSNRLIFTGQSPCWHGFFISSMGGAGLVFDNLGINMFSITGKAQTPSILYLNRNHGEDIEIDLLPIRRRDTWESGRGGVYAVMEKALEHFGHRYENDPRILATGPAAMFTDFGGIASAPIKKKEITYVDTWAGRGGFGSKLLQEHGIVGIIYGGTHIEEDFRDRKVADEWFQDKYNKKLAAKDMEVTTKYRFDPNFDTGGTFGVNFATLEERIIAFNYKSIFMTKEERLKIHKEFIVDHYLKQFNEETIKTKQQKTCGEPCAAVCKKMQGEYKKDYEPYQTMGPLCGIFDQRAAELLNHHADKLGFDAISVGGILAWLMECLSEGLLKGEDFGLDKTPIFDTKNFKVVEDSMHNAQIGVALLDEMAKEGGKIDLQGGARKYCINLSKKYGKEIKEKFVYNAYARRGWIVPNQYWTIGTLSPMAIMGKYYMDYGKDFIPPRELGRKNAHRMIQELMLDNTGICRFHRAWAEDIMPEIIDKLFGYKKEFLDSLHQTAIRINSRNASIFWETERNIDFVHRFLIKKQEEDGETNPELDNWLIRFNEDKEKTAFDFWYEIHKGIHETLREH
jgi:glyceraldehyde-3-phosphate dehydrogenase (ferredoxin)